MADLAPAAPRPSPAALRRRSAVRASLDAGRTMAGEIVADPTLFLWALYILLTPVYLFTNGLPQPGDILILVLAPVVLARWNRRMPRRFSELVRPLFAFTLYVIFVNLFWTIALEAYSFQLKTGFGLSPLFYIYNAIIFVVALIMAQRHGERFLSHTVRLVVVSVILQVAISFVYSRGTSRGTVLFNNPNQLGYFAVLSAVLILVGQRRVRLSALASTAGLVACLYLALYSASKAALACIVLTVGIGMLDRLRTIVLTGIVTAILLATSNPIADLIDKASARVTQEDSLGFIEGRGYDRIVEHPEHWLFGAGEGYYRRYATATQGSHELHSSVGTLFFCYGIAGTLIFLGFLVRAFRGAPLRRMLLMMPAIAYGFSHQGLRFTLIWMLLAVYVALKLPAPPQAGPSARGESGPRSIRLGHPQGGPSARGQLGPRSAMDRARSIRLGPAAIQPGRARV